MKKIIIQLAFILFLLIPSVSHAAKDPRYQISIEYSSKENYPSNINAVNDWIGQMREWGYQYDMPISQNDNLWQQSEDNCQSLIVIIRKRTDNNVKYTSCDVDDFLYEKSNFSNKLLEYVDTNPSDNGWDSGDGNIGPDPGDDPVPGTTPPATTPGGDDPVPGTTPPPTTPPITHGDTPTQYDPKEIKYTIPDQIKGNLNIPTKDADLLHMVSPILVRVINLILVLVGIIATLFLIFNGYQMITSGGNQESTKKAKDGITYAIIGLVLTLIAYLIIETIQDLLQLI